MYKLLRVAVALVSLSGFLHFVDAQDRKQRQPPAVRQPIAFSHQLHAGAGVKCSSCHFNAETDEQAGLPSVSDCVQCHRRVRSSRALMQTLSSHESSGKDIQWVRVYDLPDFVFFSHKVHLRASADCRTCHGQVERRTVLWKEKDISMKACVACHKEKGASTACNYCHELNR
jgi:Zn ribbon nucleic-acid-binding protein